MLYPKFSAKRLKLAISLLSFLFIHSQSLATIYYVKPTASGTGIGSSWDNASSNLKSIINGANIGDQIWVAAGSYTPPIGYNGPLPYYSFLFKNGG